MQPIPEVTEQDVIRVVRRDYPEDASAVLQELAKYGGASWHGELPRVHLAILKLAAGDASQVAANTEIACVDYRDVLAAAEYPNYMRESPQTLARDSSLVRDIIDRDWKQYQQWLTR